MKTRIFIMLILLIAADSTFAQEFRVTKTSGKLVVKLPAVIIEGYEGKDVVFTTLNPKQIDVNTIGLKRLNDAGVEDNTKIGLHVIEKGTTLEVNEAAPNLGIIKILVPYSISISYNWQRSIKKGMVFIKNIQKEIDISSRDNQIEIEQVRGPITINSTYGQVVARLEEKWVGPITITTLMGNIDVSLSTESKASLKLSSISGNVYASGEFKIALKPRKSEDDPVQFSRIQGSLNGGGEAMNLTSEHGNIYIRKNN